MQPAELDLANIHNDEDLESLELLPPGTYHFLIERIEEKDHSSFYMHCRALAGTTGELGTFKELITFPHANHRDGGQFCKKRLAKLALATGLIDRSSFGKTRVQINPSALEGRQFIARVYEDRFKRTDGTPAKTTKIDRLQIFHLCDPKVQNVPKDETAIRSAQENPPALAKEEASDDPWDKL